MGEENKNFPFSLPDEPKINEVNYDKKSTIIQKKYFVLILFIGLIVAGSAVYFKKFNEEKRRLGLFVDLSCSTYEVMSEFGLFNGGSMTYEQYADKFSSNYSELNKAMLDKKQSIQQKYGLSDSEFAAETKKIKTLIDTKDSFRKKAEDAMIEKRCMPNLVK